MDRAMLSAWRAKTTGAVDVLKNALFPPAYLKMAALVAEYFVWVR